MKKRRILVGLALASAALFSLAACGKTEEPTPTPTPTPTETPAADKVDVKFVAKFSDGAADENLTTLNKKVDKGSKVTAPAASDMAKDGYKFIGFVTSTGSAFDFNAEITKATTIYAYYDKVTVYHTLASADDNIIAEDFNNKTATDAYTKLVSYGTKGLYCGGAGDASQVAFENRKAVVRNDGTNAGKLIVDFGEDVSNSILKVTFELLMEGGDNYTFFQISTPSSTDPAFGLGLAGSSSGRKLRYKDPAGTDVTTITDFTPDATHLFELTIDLVGKKISVKMDGTQVDELNETSFASLPDEVQGMSFQTKTNKCNLELNNIAVNKGAASLDAIKAGAKASLKTAYDAIVATDYIDETTDPNFATQWAPVLAAKTAGDTAIDAAENATAALSARDTAIAAVANALDALREDLVDSLTDSTNGGIAAWTWSMNTTAQTNYNNGTDAEKIEYDAALAALKAQYIVEGKVMFKKNATDTQFTEVSNIKEGYAAFAQFEAAAKNIVKEKVDVTVKYYKYVYSEATGITEFAQGVEYYTEDSGVYTKVAADAQFDSNTTYYTYSPTEIPSSQKTYKTPKGDPTSAALVPDLKGYFTLGYFTSANLTTPYAFTENITDNSTIIYVEAANKLVHTASFTTDNTEVASGTILMAGVSVQGAAKGRYSASTPSYELNSAGAGSLKIDVATGQKVRISFRMISTGGTNTTESVKLIANATADKDATAVVHSDFSKESSSTATITDAGVITAYGNNYSKSCKVTYELEAGTYYLLTATSTRGFRVLEIELENITE